MMGHDHMVLALAWSGLFIFWLDTVFPGTNLLPYFTLGVILGSLVPDVDAEDCTLRHKNLNTVGPLGNVFPWVAIITSFMVYIPLSYIFHSTKHREIMHSLIGITVNAVVWAILLYALWFFFQAPLFLYLLWVAPGMFIGAFFHLVADSYTKMGVKWLYPRQQKPIQGGVTTGTMSEYFFVLIVFAATIGIGIFTHSPAITALATLAELVVLYPLSFALGSLN